VLDQAAGAAQGALDAAAGTQHPARQWTGGGPDSGREAEARARWHAGQPARNPFERDVYRALEAGASGIDRRAEAAQARQEPPYPEPEAHA
jgi:hypothetical protein